MEVYVGTSGYPYDFGPAAVGRRHAGRVPFRPVRWFCDEVLPQGRTPNLATAPWGYARLRQDSYEQAGLRSWSTLLSPRRPTGRSPARCYTPAARMPTHYKAHTFKESDTWETLDSYWSSPLSYWAMKSMRVEPPVRLRVVVLRREVSASEEGWINYGGLSAMFVQSVQARGRAGQKIRAIINDGTIDEDGEIRDS